MLIFLQSRGSQSDWCVWFGTVTLVGAWGRPAAATRDPHTLTPHSHSHSHTHKAEGRGRNDSSGFSSGLSNLRGHALAHTPLIQTLALKESPLHNLQSGSFHRTDTRGKCTSDVTTLWTAEGLKLRGVTFDWTRVLVLFTFSLSDLISTKGSENSLIPRCMTKKNTCRDYLGFSLKKKGFWLRYSRILTPEKQTVSAQ